MDISTERHQNINVINNERRVLLKFVTNDQAYIIEDKCEATWFLQQGGLDNIIGWGVRGFCCDKSWYNFDDPYMQLQLNENGVLLTVNVTPGQYTGSTLGPAVAAAMNLIGANTYSVIYNTITRRFTIQRTAGVLPWTIDWTVSPIKRYLGFERNVVFALGNPLMVSTDAPSLYRTLSINLRSKILGGTEITSLQANWQDNKNLLTVINVDYTDFAGTTTQEEKLIAFNDHGVSKSYHRLINPIRLEQIDLSLTYDDNLPVVFNKPKLGFAAEIEFILDDKQY